MHSHAPLVQQLQRRAAAKRDPQAASPTAAGACSVYQSPAAGDTVVAYEAHNVTWDCSCIGTEVAEIDITLYLVNGGALHGWQHVPCPQNSYQMTLVPSWWNSTELAQLQYQITQSDQPVWATTTGLGPSFEVTWNGTIPASATGSARNSTSTGASIESVRAPDTSGGVAGGKLAAAVTVPLIAAAIAVAAYILYSRRKSKGQRKRWSAYVDNRMSHYSTHPDVSASPSMADLGRPSMSMSMHAARPSLSSVRPESQNFAGIGSSTLAAAPRAMQAGGSDHRPASSFYALDGHSMLAAPGPEEHSSEGQRAPRATPSHLREHALDRSIGQGDRVSKVSFADTDPHHRASSFFVDTPPSLPRQDSSVRSVMEDESATRPAKKQHQITVSTSMPYMGNPTGRQSIMSPDDLLAAYSKGRAAATGSIPHAGSGTATGASDEDDDAAVRSSEEGPDQRSRTGTGGGVATKTKSGWRGRGQAN